MKFSSFFQNKTLLGLFAILLVAIPVTVYLLSQNQEFRQRADWFGEKTDDACTCQQGKVSCPSGHTLPSEGVLVCTGPNDPAPVIKPCGNWSGEWQNCPAPTARPTQYPTPNYPTATTIPDQPRVTEVPTPTKIPPTATPKPPTPSPTIPVGGPSNTPPPLPSYTPFPTFTPIPSIKFTPTPIIPTFTPTPTKVPTPTEVTPTREYPTTTPSSCPKPGSVNNVRIECPYCVQ